MQKQNANIAATQRFPLNDNEYKVVDAGTTDEYQPWDIRSVPQAAVTAAAAQLGADKPFEVQEEPLGGSMAQKTFVVKFKKDPATNAPLMRRPEQLSLMRTFVAGLIMDIAEHEIEGKFAPAGGNYKIGLEVKGMFQKPLRPLSSADAPSHLMSYRVLYIYRILDQSIRQLKSNEDLCAKIGALINSVIEQCLDTNHSPDSAHTFVYVIEIRIHFYRTEPIIKGGKSYIPLPPIFASSKSIKNPQNEDERCFEYATLIGLLLARHADKIPRTVRVNLCKPSVIIHHATTLGVSFKGVDSYPVTPSEAFIKNFDKANPDIHLNVYAVATPGSLSPITPILVSTNVGANVTVVNLLYWVNEEGTVAHFACITKLSGLIGMLGSNHHKKTMCPYCGDKYYYNGNAMLRKHMEKCHPQFTHDYVCEKCLNVFMNESSLEWHKSMCMITDSNYRPVILPKQPKEIKWEETMNQDLLMLPTYMVADFESVLSPMEEQVGEKSMKVHKHLCCAYGIRVVSEYPDLNKYYFYIGKSPEDTMEHFCKQILEISTGVHDFMLVCSPDPGLHMSPAEHRYHRSQRQCYICSRYFDFKDPAKRKVADHDHITGQYKGAACASCNLKRQPGRYFLPLVFHNAKGYDLHYIIREITKKDYKCRFGGIPNSSEKILSFTIKRDRMFDIRVIDSLQFLLKSLNSLVEIRKKTIPDMNKAFPFFTSYFRDTLCFSDEEIAAILKKNEFPYDWLSSYERLDAPIEELPLTDRSILTYLPVVKLVRDYLLVYLTCDVLQLADIVDAERKSLKETHSIDMLRCYGAPGYSWKAMLFFNHVVHPEYSFQCITDPNMLCFIYKSIRGGSSFISQRYFRADDTHAILYLDANNLYGWSMSQPLPYCGFEWLEPDILEYMRQSWCFVPDCAPQSSFPYPLFPDLNNFVLMAEANNDGFIFEVDLDYSDPSVQAYTYDYPLAPEKSTVAEEELSPLCRAMNAELGVKHNSKMPYLLQTVKNKSHYCVYFKNLAFYVKHGMRITAIHCGIRFKTAPVLKDYIALNTKIRNTATTKGDYAGRERAKLMNNAIYGKTYENPMKYSTLIFASTTPEAIKVQSKPGFKRNVFVSGEFSIADVKHEEVRYEKPLYLGAVITELAKLHMFEMYFDHIVPFWGRENVQLLFTDTDSLMIGIETADLWNDVKRFNAEHDNLIEDDGNPHNGEIGYFKSETQKEPIGEFVGLRSKMYSYAMKSELEKPESPRHCKAKGIGKDAMKFITHKDYLDALQGQTRNEVEMSTIRSMDHQLYTLSIKKYGLSCNDPKRYICNDNITTLPHGFYAIPLIEEESNTEMELIN